MTDEIVWHIGVLYGPCIVHICSANMSHIHGAIYDIHTGIYVHIWHIYDTYMSKEYRKLTQNIYVRIYVRTVFHICFIWATCMCSIYEPSCLIYVRYVNPIELHICILYEYMWWHICHISTYKLNIWNVSLLVYFFIWTYTFLYVHIYPYMSIYEHVCRSI